MVMDERFDELQAWLQQVLQFKDYRLEPASSDASFRRYFRLWRGAQTVIVMDAPPQREDVARFVRVARAFAAAGVHVPEVLEENAAQGFLLLGDLGVRQYLPELSEATVDRLYADALVTLQRLQQQDPHGAAFPLYDRALLERELDIFSTWFLQRHLQLSCSDEERAQLAAVFECLISNALEQPAVWVHRDYHSRNLMLTERNNPGVLDFQDAVVGPVTYDLVSLLRDCYIAWPPQRVAHWATQYLRRIDTERAVAGVDLSQFLRWFDLMGMQRHLKAIGIFARLYHRDGKAGYLKDIPRTLDYVLQVSARYGEFAGFERWLQARVLPCLAARL
jgi:aminoglycoside/choline kinase family phosphotransferase